MTSKFKVWVHIEEIDEEEDLYEDVDLPFSVGEFDTVEEAEKLCEAISTLTGSHNE
jgi:hypothetical protein